MYHLGLGTTQSLIFSIVMSYGFLDWSISENLELDSTDEKEHVAFGFLDVDCLT